jgi:hypothetical protein
MTVTTNEYTHFKDVCLDDLDWNTTPLKIALVEDSYTLSLAHTLASDVLISHECSGAGYTAGGNTLAGLTITNGQVAVNPSAWTGLTVNVRYVLLYASGTIHGLTNPVLLLFDLGSILNLSAVDWTFSWTSNVIYELA